MKVLAPIDGSDCSYEALRFAVEFARRFDADLDVVHVTDYRTDSTEMLVERAEEILEEEGFDAEPEVVIHGELDSPGASKRVGEHLLDLLEERDYDHVVMGRHGGGRIQRMLLGSASETVVKGTPTPTTIVG